MHILAAQGAIDKVQQLVRQVPAMHSGVFDDTNLRVEDTMILVTPLLYTGKKKIICWQWSWGVKMRVLVVEAW